MGSMNKVIIALVLAALIVTVSCKEDIHEKPTTNQQKYPNGTVLYAKPDSLKVVIVHFDAYDNTYKVYWRDKGEYHTDWFNETSFYGEVESEQTYE
jgi:hypothetical protein